MWKDTLRIYYSKSHNLLSHRLQNASNYKYCKSLKQETRIIMRTTEISTRLEISTEPPVKFFITGRKSRCKHSTNYSVCHRNCSVG